MRKNVCESGVAQISEMGRKRLLCYAEGFYELAKSYDVQFSPAEYEDKQEALAERRLWENRQIIKTHLNEMAKIMTEIACEALMTKPMEEKLARRLMRVLKGEGILLNPPCYLMDGEGHHSIAVTMQTTGNFRREAEEVSDLIGVALNRRLRLDDGSPFVVEADPHSFLLREEPFYTTFTGFAKATKEGERVSGDHYAFLGERNGRLTVLLSDGTGSGERAGTDSERVLDLMEKLLEAGYDTLSAMYMTNTALYAVGDDMNHPTMDVCDIDLYRGSCEILKAGAAATFFKSGNGTEKVLEGSLPLGVFQHLEPGRIHRKLEDGDYVIMVSDGIVDAFSHNSYEEALIEVVQNLKEQNPVAMANRILQAAVRSSGGRIMDDMTVLVVGVWKTGI